jgi:hypothetical protein
MQQTCGDQLPRQHGCYESLVHRNAQMPLVRPEMESGDSGEIAPGGEEAVGLCGNGHIKQIHAVARGFSGETGYVGGQSHCHAEIEPGRLPGPHRGKPNRADFTFSHLLGSVQAISTGSLLMVYTSAIFVLQAVVYADSFSYSLGKWAIRLGAVHHMLGSRIGSESTGVHERELHD